MSGDMPVDRFQDNCVPFTVYTIPNMSFTGITPEKAKELGIKYIKSISKLDFMYLSAGAMSIQLRAYNALALIGIGARISETIIGQFFVYYLETIRFSPSSAGLVSSIWNADLFSGITESRRLKVDEKKKAPDNPEKNLEIINSVKLVERPEIIANIPMSSNPVNDVFLSPI